MTNPKLTITSEGYFEPGEFFVMVQGQKFDLQNDHSSTQTLVFQLGDSSTRTIELGGGARKPDIDVDFVADRVSTSAPAKGQAGPSTGITVKQMSETGTKCGLGFVSRETLVRVVSNMGICAIQVRSSPPGSNYTCEFRIHSCSDGTVAVASATGNDAFLTWSRELGVSAHPDVIKYTAPLQDTMFFTPTVGEKGIILVADAYRDKQLVWDSGQGLCLKTTNSAQPLCITPVAFPSRSAHMPSEAMQHLPR